MTTATTIRPPALVRRGSWIYCPLLGALAGFLLRVVAAWVAGLPWAPFQGVFELAASGADPWGLLVAIALGALIGLGFAGLLAQERLVVTVGPEEVVLATGRHAREIPGDEVDAVFTERGHLVLLDGTGAELARRKSGLDRFALRDAFREHGYRWRDSDPYAGRYVLWTEDTPELSLRGNTLMAERDRALRRRDHKEAALLRAQLAEQGVVLRDGHRKQYWRKTEA
ncbi:hypothetical protein EIL87_13300 [Saccharopolyspora rhizosphaerae]|uniref:DUF308 domain-containing protein n=1 Tax=Saccharopolyspora rhizosphaerae TaxID=2492662 RepID=A0A426JSA8_9PSEU|nr:hypothetical protein [Saccharopolyspora rhizosphaerae]RRO16050.1 hypothetical protein EIL87_13300 [Saccharopolyspora rhizosphaerae]